MLLSALIDYYTHAKNTQYTHNTLLKAILKDFYYMASMFYHWLLVSWLKLAILEY